MELNFTLNDHPLALNVPEDMLLVTLLRDVLGLTGTKRGCEHGVCGACSVLLDDRPVKACRTPVRKVAGRCVVTVEGLAGTDGAPGLVQQAFLDCGAVQCGYCTPGMVIAGEALLRRTPHPTRAEIRKAITPNLCRCTGYQQIVDAIELAASRRAPGWMPGDEPALHGTGAVGNPAMRNVDGPEKVTGRATYVGDMVLPGMLHACVLRSPLPHARIAHLDVRPALDVPGVLAAITCDDFVDHGAFGWPVPDEHVLAFERVRYVGDGLVAVAAESEDAARAGLAAVALALEPLPVVADAEEALAPGAPVIPRRPVTLLDGEVAEGNVAARHRVRNGDADAVLATCATTLEAEYAFPHQEHAYLETEGALAIPEPDGGVTVYANCQSPFVNRGVLAQVLGLPVERVRVIQPPVGGAFGGKDEPVYQISAQVAKLALLMGRPVRQVLTRSESMAASYKRPATRIRLTLGAGADGTLQAAKATLLTDSGAYASMTPLSSWRASVHAAGAYRYWAVHVDTTAVYTNNGYAGAFRGFGNIQAGAAIEMAIDRLAARLGRDPLAFRLQNCLRSGDVTMTGAPLDHEVGLAACLKWVRERSDWDRKRAAYAAQPEDAVQRRGLGVACYFHGCGLGAEGADAATSTLRIAEDGGIVLTSGLTDYGQGSRTVFTVLVADVLGVDLARIRVLRPDTHTARDSGPTVASRASLVGGNAARVAAEKLLHQVRLAAADLAGCAPEQLVRDGETFIGPDEIPHTFETVVAHARRMGLPLSGEGYWAMPLIHWDFASGTGTPYFCYVFGAQVAEVAVDVRSGNVRVLKLWAAHDAGRVLYPQGALGQLYGGVAQGLGYALMEAFRFEAGVPQTLGLHHYRIPRAADMPDIEATFIETHLPAGPFGAKNLAEPVMIGTYPAIANAVFQACGGRGHEWCMTRAI